MRVKASEQSRQIKQLRSQVEKLQSQLSHFQANFQPVTVSPVDEAEDDLKEKKEKGMEKKKEKRRHHRLKDSDFRQRLKSLLRSATPSRD